MLSKTTRMQRGQDSPVDPPAATTGLSVDVVSPRRPVHIPRGHTLGILTAIGGVHDIGDLVTNAVVGSRFGLSMAWAVVVGVVEICVFARMSGRGGRERAGDIRARSRHKAGRRCWADPPESATTAESTEPAWEVERPGPGSLPWPRDLGLLGDHCGSRRVLTISLQIMINLRFSL